MHFLHGCHSKREPPNRIRTGIKALTRELQEQKKGSMMRDFVDGTAFNNEQGNRARKLFAAVVLAALDDAIADDM